MQPAVDDGPALRDVRHAPCLPPIASGHAHRTERRRGDRRPDDRAGPASRGRRLHAASGTPAPWAATRSWRWPWPAGRRRSIELGTSVLQTYTVPPGAAGQPGGVGGRRRWVGPGFTLGIGPSHQPADRGRLRPVLRRTPGRHTEEYVAGARPRCCGARRSHFDGERLPRSTPPAARSTARRSRCSCCGARAAPAAGRRRAHRRHDPLDGQRRGRSSRTSRRASRAAADARRPTGAAHRGRPPGRGARRRRRGPRRPPPSCSRATALLPNYRRLLDIGGAPGPADAAIVGDEAAVTARIEALFAAGATDVWAAIVPGRATTAPASRQRPGRSSRSSPAPSGRQANGSAKGSAVGAAAGSSASVEPA